MKFSHSGIKTYMTCPRQYRFQYIDKIARITKEANMSFIIGNAVHNTLEQLYKEATGPHVPTQEETMQRFFSYRSQEVTQARIDAGHDDLFDPDYETKQHDTAMEFIQRYYHEYYPFDQDITMQTEMNVYEELTPDIGFSGKIDRLGISGDTFTLYDYKTSKSYDPDANDTVKKQLVLYSALIARRYGHKCKRIIAKAIYLRLQNEITREVTPEMIGEILQEYQTTAQTIIDTQKAYTQENLTPDEKESLFPTQSGTHCTYCAYQIHCPLFKHQFMDDQTVTIDTMTTTSIKHMIDKYRSLKLQIKGLEEQIKVYQELLIPYAKEHNYKRLYGYTTKLGIVSKTSYKHNPDYAQELEEKWSSLTNLPRENILAINDGAINKLVTNHDIDYRLLTPYIKKTQSTYIGPPKPLNEKEIEQISDAIGK